MLNAFEILIISSNAPITSNVKRLKATKKHHIKLIPISFKLFSVCLLVPRNVKRIAEKSEDSSEGEGVSWRIELTLGWKKQTLYSTYHMPHSCKFFTYLLI